MGRHDDDDASEPLLPQDETFPGMDDCFPFPVVPVFLGYDSADLVSRFCMTFLLEYGVATIGGMADTSCTKAAADGWITLAVSLQLAGAVSVWYNADQTSAFPPTVTNLSRYQTRGKRCRWLREAYSFFAVCLYLMVLEAMVLALYVAYVYTAWVDDDAESLFDINCQ